MPNLRPLAQSYFDWNVGLHAVEIASVLEALQPGCVGRVAAAFPPNEETRSLLANAADFCEAGGEPPQINRRRDRSGIGLHHTPLRWR
jgi:hypothetical protein